MRVSIQIITYNKQSRLRFLLESISYQKNIENIKYEIVIVDEGNGSSKYVIDKYYKLPIVYIKSDHLGIPSARNIGISHCVGDIIIFLDDDVILNPEFIANHIQYHEKKETIVAVGDKKRIYISNIDKPEKSSALLEACYGNYQKLDKYIRDDYYGKITKNTLVTKSLSNISWITFVARNVSVKRNAMLEIRGFDEQLKGWGMDDIDVGYRLSKIGYEFVKNDESIVYHIEHNISSSNLKTLDNNIEYLSEKHKDAKFSLYQEFTYGRLSLQEFSKGLRFDKGTVPTNELIYYSVIR